MTNDTTLLYTRTLSEHVHTRNNIITTTTRTEVGRIDPRTGQLDLSTRTMAETVRVRAAPNFIWTRP